MPTSAVYVLFSSSEVVAAQPRAGQATCGARRNVRGKPRKWRRLIRRLDMSGWFAYSNSLPVWNFCRNRLTPVNVSAGFLWRKPEWPPSEGSPAHEAPARDYGPRHRLADRGGGGEVLGRRLRRAIRRRRPHTVRRVETSRSVQSRWRSSRFRSTKVDARPRLSYGRTIQSICRRYCHNGPFRQQDSGY